MNMNLRVDLFMKKSTAWHDEYVALRKISPITGFKIAIKWMYPCYARSDKNVILLHLFRESINNLKGVGLDG